MELKMDPKRLEDELLRVIFKLWRPLERREGVRRAAEEPQEEPKMVCWPPRDPQEHPRGAQELPKRLSRGAPKRSPRVAQNTVRTMVGSKT